MTTDFPTITENASEADKAAVARMAVRIYEPIEDENPTIVAAACLHIAFTLFQAAGATQEQAAHVCSTHGKAYLRAGN